jgi:uncharacterized membrane protein
MPSAAATTTVPTAQVKLCNEARTRLTQVLREKQFSSSMRILRQCLELRIGADHLHGTAGAALLCQCHCKLEAVAVG